MSFVYKFVDHHYSVGFYAGEKWVSVFDTDTAGIAAQRCHYLNGGDHVQSEKRLSRDEFAAAAMTGLLANIQTCQVLANDIVTTKRLFCEEVAHVAYDHADAMLAERDKKR